MWTIKLGNMSLAINLNTVKKGIILGLLILLSWQLATLVWLFLPAESVIVSGDNYASSSNKRNKAPVLNIKHITALNLFGVSESFEKTEQQEKQQISAPETSLNLKLRGLRKGHGSIKSSAIIENKDGVQAIYYLGDEIQGYSQVEVYEIYSQHLILERAGKYETLTLFEVLQEEQSKERGVGQRVKPSATKRPLIDKTKNRDLTKRLSDIVGTLKANPLSLNGTMIIQPAEDKYGFQGYKVAPGKDKLLFTRLGFVKGDVITHINNIALDSAGKLVGLMETLSSAEELEVNVMRRGQSKAFRYRVK